MALLILGTSSLAPRFLSFTSALSFSESQALTGVFLSTRLTSCISTSATSPALPLIHCGRGDKKTAKGKRFNHSFGNARPRDKKNGRGPPRVPVPPSPRKKDPYDDDEVIKIDIDE